MGIFEPVVLIFGGCWGYPSPMVSHPVMICGLALGAKSRKLFLGRLGCWVEDGSVIRVVDIWVFPKNRGTPKWMVYNGNPIKMDDLGVPLFLETPILKGKKLPRSMKV